MDWVQKGSDFVGLLEDVFGGINGELLGYSVSINSDGSIIAIGCPFNNNIKGRVIVYYWNIDKWTQKGNDIIGESENDFSGGSISLSSDGNIIAIGAPYNNGKGKDTGQVRVYFWNKNTNTWSKRGKDIDNKTKFGLNGYSVSLSSNGNILAIGAPSDKEGTVSVFEWKKNTWVKKGSTLKGHANLNNFGYSVSLNKNGNILAIGEPFAPSFPQGRSGFVRIFIWKSNKWIQLGKEIKGGYFSSSQFGTSVSLNDLGNTIAIGSPEPFGNSINGNVQVYDLVNSVWVQRGNDIYGKDYYERFGKKVKISGDGNTVIVSSPLFSEVTFQRGKVNIYQWIDNNWIENTQVFKGNNSYDRYGMSIDITDDAKNIIIGSFGPYEPYYGFMINEGYATFPRKGYVQVFTNNINNTNNTNNTNNPKNTIKDKVVKQNQINYKILRNTKKIIL